MTPDDMLAHLRAHPKGAFTVARGLGRFGAWTGNVVFPLIDWANSNPRGGEGCVAMVASFEDKPAPRIQARVWAEPEHTSWHSTPEDARAAVEAHLKANGWVIVPQDGA